MSSLIPEIEAMGYPENSDITIMNTYYSFPEYSDGHKVSDDKIFLVFKDNVTNEKKYKIIEKPDYTFYKIKDGEKIPNYNQMFIEKEKVEPVTVPFMKLEANIAHAVGKDDEYKQNLFNHNKAANKIFHTEPSIFFSDVNIEDHYRFKFANSYTNNICKISKGFFDIEVDALNCKGEFVEMGECPVNCVSFLDETSNTVYVFILRDQNNPLIQEFENKFINGQFNWQTIHDFIVEAVGGVEKAEEFGLMETNFNLRFFDHEIELLAALFNTMHQCSPDFIETWNGSGFDIPYIIQRIYNLGYQPEEIMCDKTWKIKAVKHMIDTRHINEPAERGDFTFISGLPVFLDQYIQYASRRKAKMGSYKSLKLDDIGELEAGVHKLDYSHITHKVTELPWLDFQTFVLYNIMDTVVQKCIEKKTQDLEYIFAKCIANNTVYRKGHRQTTYLINRMANDWYKMGYIIGNNCNRNNEKPPKFLGALVGNPDNTNDYSKLKINGNTIWLCDNLIDYDFRALYPSVMGEFNIAPNTQVGKIIIAEKVYSDENAYHNDPDKYSRSGEFIENMVTDNPIEYCHRWFHLANIEEIIDDIDEFFRPIGLGNYSDLLNGPWVKEQFALPAFLPTANTVKDAFRTVNCPTRSPFIFHNRRNPELNYNELKERKDDK